jgi:hypothetical protein
VEPWAPAQIIGEEWAERMEAEGHAFTLSPEPDPCPVCGVPLTACTGHESFNNNSNDNNQE